jgi:hypothetical protein
VTRPLFWLTISVLVSACATTPYKAKIAKQPSGASIGVIDWLPKGLVHHHYGLFAGLSQRHDAYPVPFDVGAELSTQLSQQINAGGTFKAVVIPTPPELQSILPDIRRIGDKSYKFPEVWFGEDFSGLNVKAAFGPLFDRLAIQHGVQLFLITAGRWEAPLHLDNLPGGYSSSVFTKYHPPTYFSYTMLAAACLAFDVKQKRVENICPRATNAITIKDYRGPESAQEVLPRMEEITENLHKLITIRATAGAEALLPASPQ